MTTAELIAEVAPYIEIVKLVGICGGFVSIVIAYRSYRKNVAWNRINASFGFLSSAALAQREAEVMSQLCGVYTFQRRDPLTPKEAADIYEDQTRFLSVKELLNEFDNYAVAISAGALHPEVAYQTRSGRLLRHFRIFHPLISLVRQQLGNDQIWIHFEIAAEEWERRKSEESRMSDAQKTKIKGQMHRRLRRATKVYG